MKKFGLAIVLSFLCSSALATPPVYGPLQAQNNLDDVDSASTSLANLGGAPLASPTFTGIVTTPSGSILNTPASINLSNATNVPYSSLPALSANQILGSLTSTTPSGQSVPSCSASNNALLWTSGTGFSCNTSINAGTLGGTTFASPGPIGSTTASTGAFTTLSASSTVSGTGFSNYLASPPSIGGTTPASGKFTTLTATSTVTGIGLIGIQVFTSSGTYTEDSGTQEIIVEVQAQGGGGGGCATSSSTQNCISGAGNSGSYAKVFYTSSFSPETINIGTAGAGGSAGDNNGTGGGTASFGSLVSCPGGGAGSGGAAFTATTPTILFPNRTTSSCTISGGTTISSIPTFVSGFSQSLGALGTNTIPSGANSILGIGGVPQAGQAAGGNASGFGAGGSGGATSNGSAVGGGNPSGGEIVIYEYN